MENLQRKKRKRNTEELADNYNKKAEEEGQKRD